MEDTKAVLSRILPEWHLVELETMKLPDKTHIDQYAYMKPDFFRALNRMKESSGGVIDAVVSLAGVLTEKATGILADLTSMPRVPAYGVRSPSAEKTSGCVVLSKQLGDFEIQATSLVSGGRLSFQVMMLEHGRQMRRPYQVDVFDINKDPVIETQMVMPDDDPPVFKEPEPGEYEFVLSWDNWNGHFRICFENETCKATQGAKQYKWAAPDINRELVRRAIEKEDPGAREELWIKIVQLVYWLATPGFCKRYGIDPEDVGDLIHRVLTQFTSDEPVLPEMDPKKRKEEIEVHRMRQRRLLESGNLPGFFVRVLENKAKDFCRKRKNRGKYDGGSLNEHQRNKNGDETHDEKLDMVDTREEYKDIESKLALDTVSKFIMDHFPARECEVFFKLVQGFSAKEVGEQYGLTPYRVYGIRDRIREKIKTLKIRIPQEG